MNAPRLVALIAACGLSAGCGSASEPTAGSQATRNGQALAFSECMRAHGVSGFPDPGAALSGPANTIGGIAFPTSINMQAPTVAAAMKSCQPIIADILSPPDRPKITSALKASMISNAQCVRTHGVPSFPDPTFPASGGIAVRDDPSVDENSPAFTRAASACGEH